MEAKLDNILETMMQQEKAIGASLSDNKLGFSYGSELKMNEMLMKFFLRSNFNFSKRKGITSFFRINYFHHGPSIETSSK